MARGSLRWLWIVGSTLLAIVPGIAVAALGTAAGRGVIVRSALAVANDQLRGQVSIDGFDGSLLEGLQVAGLRITDPEGGLLASVGELHVRYRVRDFLTGRIVLGQLSLSDVEIRLAQDSAGRFNYHRILRMGEGDGGGGPDPLVAFNDVVLERVAVTVLTGDPARPDVRTVGIPRGRLPYLRLASPLPTERGILIRVDQLLMDLSEPALAVRGAEGEIHVVGDSVRLDLTRASLPATRGALRGLLLIQQGGLGLDLDAVLRRFRSDDLRGLVPLLPRGFTGRVDVGLRTPGSDRLAFDARNLAVTTPDGGRASGRLAMTLGPGARWRLDGVDLTTRDFAVRHLEAIMDTVPFRGTLTGRTQARGPAGGFDAAIDWQFRDARVPGRPRTDLAGSGVIALGVPGDLVFRSFRIDRAQVALATVREFVPAIALAGRIDAVGTLDGAWQEAAFSGSLRHVAGTLPVTVARGLVRLDGRGPVFGIWADLAFDSLQLAGWRPSYPAIPLRGAFAGDVALAGYLDSLAARVNLTGPLGVVRGGGTVVAAAPRLGVQDMDLRFENLVVEQLSSRLSGSRFTGTARGHAVVDSARHPVVELAVALDRSRIGGVGIDSGRARIRAADSLLRADTLDLWLGGTRLRGAGGLAFRAPRRDSLTVEVDIDSLGALMPLVRRVLGAETPPADTVRGRVRATATLTGALDTFALAARVSGRRLQWDAIRMPAADVEARWAGGTHRMDVALDIDSVAFGRLGFALVEAGLSGTPDTFAWRARSRIGEDAAVLAGGRWAADSSGRRIHFDSAAVLLASAVWFLQRGAAVELRDTAVTMRDFSLAPPGGASRIAVDGVLPLRGPGNLNASVERFPVRDLWALVQYDPREAGGEIGGELTVRGTARAPVLEATLALTDGVFGEFRAPRVETRLTYRDRELRGTGGLWRLGQQIMELEIALPVNLAVSGADRRRLPGPLTVRARADGVDLAFLAALYPQIRQTSGRMSADVGIAGSWEGPILTGELTVENGAATLPALGVRHERLNGRLVLSGDTIHVRQMSITSGGTASLSGFVRLEGLTAPVLGLEIRAQDFRAVDVREFLTATVSGDARLTGPVFGATLTGQATVPQGVLWFADIVEKDIFNLEDTLLVGAEERELIRRQGLGQQAQNRFLEALRIDSLNLEMGNNVLLRSSEANIALTGQVLVNKTGQQYRVDGLLRTPRGTYLLPLAGTIEREFTVTRGEVRYFGTPDLNAGLDIEARHVVRSQRGDPVTILVHIGGTVQTPSLELSSDIRPPISDTEIISYLLVGAPSVQAGTEGLPGRVGQQLAEQVAARISGQLGNTLIADLSLPLDYLEFRPAVEQGGLGRLVLGKRLGQRFFLSFSPRICPQEQWTYQNIGGSVEFRMTREVRFSLSADPVSSCRLLLGEGSEQRYQLGLDVFWEKNY